MKRLGIILAVMLSSMMLWASVAMAGPYQQGFRIWTVGGSVSCPTDYSACSWKIGWENLGDLVTYNVYTSTDPNIAVTPDAGAVTGLSTVAFGTGTASGAGNWGSATAIGAGVEEATLTLSQYNNHYVRVTSSSGLSTIMKVYAPDKIPHGSYATETNLCLNCHQTHSGQSPRMLRAASAAALCTTCHNGMGSKYDVLDSQIRGAAANATETQAAAFATGFESPAGAFGSVATSSSLTDEGDMHSRISSNHTLTVNNISAAPGSGGTLTGELSCVSCHNPHGNSNYRILKTTNNGFKVDVPALSVTDAAATGKETSAYFGGYNPEKENATGLVATSTRINTTTPDTVVSMTLTVAEGSLTNGNLIVVTQGLNDYVGTLASVSGSDVTITPITPVIGSWLGAGAGVTGANNAYRDATFRTQGGSANATYTYASDPNSMSLDTLSFDPTNYVKSFMEVIEPVSGERYWGQITTAGSTTTATLRVVRRSAVTPTNLSSTAVRVMIPEADPNAGITTLCQSCHTSFAMARSAARASGVSNDTGDNTTYTGGGNTGESHKYRHAIGIKVYPARGPDRPAGWQASDYEAIPNDAVHPEAYDVANRTFPYRVVLENTNTDTATANEGWRTDATPADGGATATENRVVCISCHFAHGTDRFGLNPVTNGTVSSTETVAAQTTTANDISADGATPTVFDEFDPDAPSSGTLPEMPAGLQLTLSYVDTGVTYSESRTIKYWTTNATTGALKLDSAFSTSFRTAFNLALTADKSYTIIRTIDSMNPNDTDAGTETASTVLKRVSYMGVCMGCHQKDADSLRN